MKNILILSDFLPKEGWGGGVIIRSLTKHYPKSINLFWTAINANNTTETCNNIKLLDFRFRYFRGRGKFSFILMLDSIVFAYCFNKFIKKNQINKLWIVLGTSYHNLMLIEILIKKIRIPFHISIHDDPIIEINKKYKSKAETKFKSILTKAESIDVISTRMQQHYKNRFGVHSIVITRCIPEDFPQNSKLQHDEINIVMGGYGNASAPWPKVLIDAVLKLNELNNYKLHLFDPKLKEYESSFVKIYDLVDELSFNSILQTINLGYACDDLRPEKELFAQLSLPTKIITYIGAGIPFLYHGPKNSTVSDLLQKFDAGILVSTNNVTDLVDAFLLLQSNYSYYQKKCKEARENLFAEKVVQNYFFENLLNFKDNLN